ncbi:MAG: HAMP domain-containing histidine kinase [Deltaproteobacteria bacterium]|nr:HAMP domain-containing histidine kinase [Deltaproteobacteria bacterium]
MIPGTPELRDWLGYVLTGLAAAGTLGLAVLASTRAKSSVLAPPVALLCLDLCVFNASDLAFKLTGGATWGWIDTIGSSLTVPLTAEFVLAFVGERAVRRRLRAVIWLWFGTLAVSCLIPIFDRRASVFHDSGLWAVAVLLGTVPVVAHLAALLLRHRRGNGEAEAQRATWVLGAMGIATLLGSTDLLASAGLPVPRMANLGMLAGSLVLADVALRGRLLGDLAPADAAKPMALAASSIGAYLAVVPRVAEHVGALVFATVVLILGLVAGLQRILRSRAERAERSRTLAFMGRMSDQLAHDLKNPIAAIKGAAQVLVEEVARRRAPDASRPLLELIIDQADRLDRVANTYRRLGRLELELETLDLCQLIRNTLVPISEASARPGVRASFDLPPSAIVEADRDLLSAALENVLRNALEAIAEHGEVKITVRVEPTGTIVEIEDTGIGMDARQQAQAFDEFFTTKAGGSGLGLGLARRVIAAHHGAISLDSRPSKGTRVRVRLPTKQE